MDVSNYYTDLTTSLVNLLENKIFFPGYIKSYESNLGEQSLQLDIETQHELPSVLIEYSGSTPIKYNPYTIQHTPMNTVLKTLVLYNKTKEMDLNLVEEHYEIKYTIVINCLNQLNAIDVVHRIQQLCPENHPLKFYNYYSFLPIDKVYLDTILFDTEYDEIDNLFSKFNRVNNRTDYFYSMFYEPIIRFDSIQNQIAFDSKSSQVSCDLSIFSQVPVYLEVPHSQRPRNFSYKKEIKKDDIICVVNDEDIYTTILVSYIDPETNILNEIPFYIFNNEYNLTTGYFEKIIIINGKKYIISGYILKEIFYCSCQIDIKGNIYSECYLDIENNFIENKLKIDISGDIITNLNNPELSKTEDNDINYISGLISTTIDNNKINEYIIIDELNILSRSKIIDNYKIQPNNDIDINIKIIPISNILNTNLEYKPNLITVDFTKSEITSITILNKETNEIFKLDGLDIKINSDGTFIHTSTFNENLNYTAEGKIDRKTGKIIYYDLTVNPDTNENYKLLSFKLNLAFKIKSQLYGKRSIERINLFYKVKENDNSDIIINKSYHIHEDIYGNLSSLTNHRLLFNNIINIENDLKNTYSGNQDTINNKDIFIKVHIVNSPSIFNDTIVNNILNNDSKVYWRFIFDKNIIDSYNENITPIEYSDDTKELIFKADKKFLYETFADCFLSNNQSKIIFFQLFRVD